MADFANFKEKILNEYPRLKKDDKFTFSCNPGKSCFNKCCNDVNIFLTPYDIIRLRQRLGVKSSEFLDKYTILPIEETMKHPVVMLKMDEETLNCPFVDSEKGCTVYEDRPWSCRMFPIGMASPAEFGSPGDEFYFLLKEDVCKGFEGEGKEWTIQSWMDHEGVEKYNELGELFKEISLHERFLSQRVVQPVKLEMFYMVCYNIDDFREFVFNSTFLKRFKISDEQIEKMQNDDEELLKFGFRWLRLAIFGEKTLRLREEYIKPQNAL